MKTEFRDINKLQEVGYTIIECSPWHFKVYGQGNVMNVWPSKRKFMLEYGRQASFYKDIVETVKRHVGPPQIGKKVRRRLKHRISSDNQAKAKVEYDGMMKKLLDKIQG